MQMIFFFVIFVHLVEASYFDDNDILILAVFIIYAWCKEMPVVAYE